MKGSMILLLGLYWPELDSCVYLGRAGQEPTENVCLDRPVQNGLSCGLCGSVWLCSELSRTKCFADENFVAPWPDPVPQEIPSQPNPVVQDACTVSLS